jgi:hypothetical protein
VLRSALNLRNDEAIINGAQRVRAELDEEQQVAVALAKMLASQVPGGAGEWQRLLEAARVDVKAWMTGAEGAPVVAIRTHFTVSWSSARYCSIVSPSISPDFSVTTRKATMFHLSPLYR